MPQMESSDSSFFSLIATSHFFLRPPADTTCPLLPELLTERTEGERSRGYDVMKHIMNSAGKSNTSGDLKTIVGTKLYKVRAVYSTRVIFPFGLPEEFSIICMFRVRRTSRGDSWYFWLSTDHQGKTQLAVSMDGRRKVMQVSGRTAAGHVTHAVFSSRTVTSLFDRKWHVLALKLGREGMAISVDCGRDEWRSSRVLELTDMQGKVFVGARLRDGRPVNIFLKGLWVHCDPDPRERRICCAAFDKCDDALRDMAIPLARAANLETRRLTTTMQTQALAVEHGGERFDGVRKPCLGSNFQGKAIALGLSASMWLHWCCLAEGYPTWTGLA
uniref:Thrombospondin-like N-terminal domain-containing protein n=1 Tax=Eptatretus burgeri TaxID=7764 RepID=A0A8C4NBU7_EPTBU